MCFLALHPEMAQAQRRPPGQSLNPETAQAQGHHLHRVVAANTALPRKEPKLLGEMRRNHQTVFQSGHNILGSHQPHVRVPVAPIFPMRGEGSLFVGVLHFPHV